MKDGIGYLLMDGSAEWYWDGEAFAVLVFQGEARPPKPAAIRPDLQTARRDAAALRKRGIPVRPVKLGFSV